MLDVQSQVEVFESSIGELLPIVSNYGVRNSKATNDISPDKLLHLLCCDGCQWVGLNPFCKIIYSDQQKLDLPLSRGEWAHLAKGHGEEMMCSSSCLTWDMFPCF